MINTDVCKLMTTNSVRAWVIALDLGLVLLTNGCVTAPVLKYESHTSLDMIEENRVLEKSNLMSLGQPLNGSDINNTEDLEKFFEGLGIEEIDGGLKRFFTGEDLDKRQVQEEIQKQENEIVSECKISLRTKEKDIGTGGPGIQILSLGVGASIFMPIIIDKISEELGAQLEKYAAVYEAKETITNFYEQTGRPELRSKCFQFSRFPKEEPEAPTKETPVVNLIGQMRLTHNRDALQIRPLRLYQTEAMAKSDDGSYGIAASIRMNAVWRQKNRGMSEEVFNHTFLKEKITLSNSRPVLRYFLDKKWEDYPVLPLPPWSTNVGSSSPAGNVEITISVAESGNPNEVLKFVAKLFKSERKNLAELLKNAAKAGLD